MLEYRRNQILLNLARSIFEEQNNLECLVTKIMKEARDLLKCERCAVFLVDLECCEAVREILAFLLFFFCEKSLIIIYKFSTHSHAHQSHLERMLMSVNQIDYEESNKPENDASKKVCWPLESLWTHFGSAIRDRLRKDDNDLTIFSISLHFHRIRHQKTNTKKIDV